MNGALITLEGIEGAGKTTQAQRLRERLEQQGRSVVLVREPGGTGLGEEIRRLLLQKSSEMGARAELLLFLAARAQLTDDVIRPAVLDGCVVVCDRYIDSTVAYQGYGRGLDLSTVTELNVFATAGLEPDITFVLDVPPELGLTRQQDRNRMEEEPLDFHRRVRDGYLAVAASNPRRVVVIDGSQSPDSVHAELWRKLCTRGIAT